MIECSICNAANEDRSLFCSECGQRLAAKSQSIASDSDQTTSEVLLQTPRLDAVPSHPSFKLHSPILDLGASEKNQFNRKGGSSGLESEYEGTVNQESSGRNPNSISRNGLHSPLLDGRDKNNSFPKSGNFANHNSKSVQQADLISQLSSDPSARSSSDPSQQTKPRRSNQGLRSPLLGGGSDYQSAENHDSIAHDMPSKLSGNDQSMRLHSPVLDGPAEASRRFAPHEPDIDRSSEEYDSLRSPILGAKVPLPDKSQLSQGPDLSGLPLNKANDQLVNQPVDTSLSQFPDDKNFNEFKFGTESANTSGSANSPGQQTIQSILNASTGLPTKPISQSASAFTPLLFDQSQTETGDKPVVSPANKPIYFSGISDLNKSSNISSSRTMPAISLPLATPTEKLGAEQTGFAEKKSAHPFYRVIVIIMIVAAIVFKFCYLQALGNTIFTSVPFSLDQVGQIFVMLMLLFLALTAKF